MDTQPRAEEENLPQSDVPEQSAPQQISASSIEQDLIAAEELLLATDVAADAIDAPDEAETDDPVDDIGDVAIIEAHADPVAEEPSLLDLSPEDLTLDGAPETAPAAVIEAPAMIAESVSDADFAQMVDDSLEAVGGILLFKMRIDEDGEDKHVAAASIGDGGRRQFLLLSLPVTGGKLKVESASRSTSPLAKLAEAYVGVVEAFRAAA